MARKMYTVLDSKFWFYWPGLFHNPHRGSVYLEMMYNMNASNSIYNDGKNVPCAVFNFCIQLCYALLCIISTEQ